MSGAPTALGPMPCINCGQRVLWIRGDGFWRLRDEDGAKHRCGTTAKNRPGAKAA